MRHLISYTEDAVEFINSVISSTRKHKDDEITPDNTYKMRCNAIVASNIEYIRRYKTEFDNDSLEDIEGTHPKLEQREKEDFSSLYKYSRKPIKALRHKVLTDKGYENNFCPLCGVNLVNTMDHFIPQTDYPLFTIHPLNLIPSCDTCNKGKSDIIKDGNKRKFWNVYLDTPPEEKYVECEVKEGTGGIVEVDFLLKKGNIDANTFRLLENTMLEKGQNVFGVFKQASGRIISKFINKAVTQIRKVAQSKSLQECLKDLECEVDNEFEVNDCESEIKKAIVSSPIFINNLKDELDRLGVAYRE